MSSHASHLSRTAALCVVAALTCAGSVAAVVAHPAPARADVPTAEAYPFPASRVLTVDGHGWGHGEGLSQQGAKQGALNGVPATGILSFYYPGATLAGAGNPMIRIALTGVADGPSAKGYLPPSPQRYQCSDGTAPATYCTLTVVQSNGLVVTDTATGKHPDPVSGADEWGVASNKDGLHLRVHTTAGWADAHVGGRPAVLAGPVTFDAPTFVRVDWAGGVLRDYRHQVSAVRTDPGSATTPSRMLRLATMPLDDYVRGVVYQESPASWPLQELEAQAIAARSYADSLRLANNPLFDLCDSTYCQVFGGSQVSVKGKLSWLEPALGQTATDPVAQTADTILVRGSTPVFAQFSASNGGWTAGGDPSYGPVRPDAWDAASGDPYGSWVGTINAADLEAAYGFKRLDVLTVTSRDGTTAPWGGRVRSVLLTGVDGAGRPMSVTVTDQAALRFGLRSTFWRPRLTAPTVAVPATIGRGHIVLVTGRASPGAAVDVWFHKQGTVGYTKRRSVVAALDGSWRTTFVADLDYRVYGVSQGLPGRSVLVKALGTTLVAPAKVKPGAIIRLSGLAPPSSRVVVGLHRAGLVGFVSAAAVKSDRWGHWKAAVSASVKTRFVATSVRLKSLSRLVLVG
ncbi:MAG: stage sporulation protein [Frankiales bacterium]|nr:stage sporulation protein [Frankiales bacterium]